VSYPEEEPEIEEPEEADVEEPTAGAGEERPAGKRRRRRRRRGGARGTGVDEVRTEPLAAEDDLEEASPAAPENEEADRPVASAKAGETPSGSEETTDTASEAASVGPATKGRSRRRRPRDEKSTSIVESTPFGDVIDLGKAEPAEVVDVPETTATAPRRVRERVRKAVEVVLAAADGPDASKESSPDDVRSAAQSETVEVVGQSSTGEPTIEAKDQVSELASASVAPSSAEDEESKASAPKRRGWWSRALGGGLD
jgi:ribonuclease E